VQQSWGECNVQEAGEGGQRNVYLMADYFKNVFILNDGMYYTTISRVQSDKYRTGKITIIVPVRTATVNLEKYRKF